ncbi:MAG: TadE/TadG family type IV pilus assembly protein [Pseudomonadota bacterium]
MKQRNVFRKFLKDTKGATAVEFALLALPFLVMVIGSIQLGIIFLANQSLDKTINDVSRLVWTGAVQQAGLSENALRERVCQEVIFVPDCGASLAFSVQSFPDAPTANSATLFDANGHPIVSNGFNPGQAGDVIVVAARIEIPIVLSDLFAGTAPAATVLSSANVFINEPFQ